MSIRLSWFGVLCALAFFFAPSPASANTHGQTIWRNLGGDFGAFYCSGAVTLTGKNPYLVEPLRSCENQHQPLDGRSDKVVDPAPLPGYDLAFFASLARLPYTTAKVLWYAILVASIVITTLTLARLTQLPLAFVLASIVLVDGVLSFTYGQLPAVVVAALSLAAYLLERQRFALAAVAASAAMLEPHLGLPACVAMFVWFPRCRVPFVAVFGALAALALTFGGPARNIAYFTTYLPAHAQSELVASDQFSLSALLHIIGFSDGLALAFGSLSYLVMTVGGIWLGRHVSGTLKSDGFVALLPPAAALVGGSFIHDIQFAVALPAALLLFAKTRPNVTSWIALSLLIFPWYSYSSGGFSIGTAVRIVGFFVTGWLAWIALSDRSRAARTSGIALSMAAFCVLLFVFAKLPQASNAPPKTLAAESIAGNVLASVNWGAYLRATPSLSTPSIRNGAKKIPSWLGVILVLTASVRSRPQAPRRRMPADSSARFEPSPRETYAVAPSMMDPCGSPS